MIGYYIIGQNTDTKKTIRIDINVNLHFHYQIIKSTNLILSKRKPSNFQITTNLTQFKRIKTRLTKTHKNELVSDKNIE